MSETEEPPSKVQKLSLGESIEDHQLEEGQEEWLSEEMLTDDDSQQPDQLRSEGEVTTCDDSTLPSIHDSTEVSQNNFTALELKDAKTNSDQQIEQTLDNLENSTMDLPDELGAFLVRKPDRAQRVKSQESTVKQSEEDNGNDTDDLLRMLGEDDKNKKKHVMKSMKERSRARDVVAASSDDDMEFKGGKITKYQVSKNVTIKQPTRALPEDVSTECETSDDDTMKNRFASNTRKVAPQQKPKPQPKQQQIQRQKQQNSSNNTIAQKKVHTQIRTSKPNIIQKPPLGQFTRIIKKTPQVVAKSETRQPTGTQDKKKDKEKHAEIINEAEFLDDDEFDLDDDFARHSDGDRRVLSKQRIMKPEEMDEDVPSDKESGDESLFDEFPSSASEDEFEDWFHLDIRAETAGDFLPLIGAKAFELLTEEKNKVAARVATLKENMNSLMENSKAQTEELNKASLTLADLDAMLAAS